MQYDKDFVASKLRRWEKYIDNFRLPAWDDIPDIGLYMEQVIRLLKEYLDYLPPELKEEQFITPATINNYVRTKIIPEPVKKKYYRQHIVYLIMVLTLKQSLSLSVLQKFIPVGLSEEELKSAYISYARRHKIAAEMFVEQVRQLAGGILEHEDKPDFATDSTIDLLSCSAVISTFFRLLAEKLLLLDGATLENNAQG